MPRPAPILQGGDAPRFVHQSMAQVTDVKSIRSALDLARARAVRFGLKPDLAQAAMLGPARAGVCNPPGSRGLDLCPLCVRLSFSEQQGRMPR
jgi:hypothetical protein